MIDLDKLPEFPGFSVYRISDGEAVGVDELLEELYGHKCKKAFDEDCVALSEDGTLWLLGNVYSWSEEIPKQGKYIIQIGNDMYRW